MTQKELNNVLTNKVVEQSNQMISMQILLYSLVDLIIEKELISKEELEEKFLKFNGTILDFYNYAEEFFYKTPASVRKDNRGRPKKVLNQPLPRVLQPKRGRGRPKTK